MGTGNTMNSSVWDIRKVQSIPHTSQDSLPGPGGAVVIPQIRHCSGGGYMLSGSSEILLPSIGPPIQGHVPTPTAASRLLVWRHLPLLGPHCPGSLIALLSCSPLSAPVLLVTCPVAALWLWLCSSHCSSALAHPRRGWSVLPQLLATGCSSSLSSLLLPPAQLWPPQLSAAATAAVSSRAPAAAISLALLWQPQLTRRGPRLLTHSLACSTCQAG